MRFEEYDAIIEAVLFASGEAVSLEQLADCLELDKATTKKLLQQVQDRLFAENRGVQLVVTDQSYQLCSAPKYHAFIKKLLGDQPNKALSQTLLETLAIIAYMQPVTKSQIEEIRGVSADHAVNKLIEKRLVSEKGRLNAPGKPLLFGTTQDFLKGFGLKSLRELPEIETLSETPIPDYTEGPDSNSSPSMPNLQQEPNQESTAK